MERQKVPSKVLTLHKRLSRCHPPREQRGFPMHPALTELDPRSNEFAAAVRDFAIEDAVLVGNFIEYVRQVGNGQSFQPDVDDAFRLAAILRQFFWEQRGIVAHQAAGLGSSEENAESLSAELKSGLRNRCGQQMVADMLGVLHESILWKTTNPDVRFRASVDVDLDGQALDALVDFLIERAKGG